MNTAATMVERFHEMRDEDFCSKCSAEADLSVTETRHYKYEDELGRSEDAEIEESVPYCVPCYRAEELAKVPSYFSPVYEERLREAVSCHVVPVQAIEQHVRINVAGALERMIKSKDFKGAAQCHAGLRRRPLPLRAHGC